MNTKEEAQKEDDWYNLINLLKYDKYSRKFNQ